MSDGILEDRKVGKRWGEIYMLHRILSWIKWKIVSMKLSNFPERFQLVAEEPWRTEGIRKMVVKNFLVYYWVDKINMKVQVTAVIYERRNQIEQLKKMHIEK